MRFRFLLFFIFSISAQSLTIAQKNIDLEEKIKVYLEAESANQQYDALAVLMEFNASVTTSEAGYYSRIFNSENYQKVDKRYPLLANFILADVLYYNDQADSALYHYLHLASEAGLKEERMLAASGLGNAAYVLSDLGDKVGAINLLKQNRDISKSTGDIRDLSDHTFSIAKSYADLEQRDSAIHYLEMTIDIDRKAKNNSGMLYNMQILLQQYIGGNKLEKALQLCEECFMVSQQIDEKRALAACHNYSAQALFKLGQYEKSEVEFQEAIAIDEDRGDFTRMSIYNRGLGDILLVKENFKEANKKYELAIAAAEKNDKQHDRIESYLAFSKALGVQNRYKEALQYNDQAADIINDNQLNTYLLDLYKNYSSLYTSKNDLTKALEYEQKESDLLEARLDSRNVMATDQSRNAYDLFKMEGINRTLQAEKLLADAKLKRRNTMIGAGGIILLLALILVYLFFQVQRQRSREKAQALEYQVLEKEMTALRSQMNPHFLFNSLSSINDYIMHENPRLASKYLTKFSHLMRTILNNSREKLITLESELQAATLYVEMENLRFKEQFLFTVTLDEDIDVENVMIPSMLIQPYLENAIKHGLRNSSLPGKLTLEMRKVGDQLHIYIEDNGIGREEAMKLKARRNANRKSFGMEITNDRIDLLNKIHHLDVGAEIIDKEDPKGTQVIIKIKYLHKEQAIS